MIEIRETDAYASWFGDLRDAVAKSQGDTVVILLAGGDKSSQRRDIEKATRLARNL